MIEPSKLHAYVDGELNDAERQEVELRLATCSASQAEVASIRSLKSALGGVSHAECEAVWANCKSRLDAIDRVAKSGNFITKYSWAFVTAVALFLVIGGGYARHAEAGSVDSSALAGVFANTSRTTPEKASRNAELDRILSAANQKLSQIKFISETRTMLEGRMVQRLDIEDGQGRLFLIVLPQVSSFDGMTADQNGQYFFGSIDSQNKGVGWKVKDVALILVGPREYKDLEKIARTNFVPPQ